MSFETELAKFKKQVDSFSIAGAFGNFHTGFSIGDATRGAGAGVKTAEPNTPEEILTSLENSFKNFTIRGGHDVSVSGSLVAGGFAISAKPGFTDSGVGTGPPPPPTTGACCDGTDCFVLSPDGCAEISGVYQGDDAVCDPNPCANGMCCELFDDGFVSCDFRTETECNDLLSDPSVVSTSFQPDEIDCFHNRVCPDIFGAGGCCFSDSSGFIYLDEASCLAAGGTSFLGAGVMYWDVPCP